MFFICMDTVSKNTKKKVQTPISYFNVKASEKYFEIIFKLFNLLVLKYRSINVLII